MKYIPQKDDLKCLAKAIATAQMQYDIGGGYRWQYDLVDGEMSIYGWLGYNNWIQHNQNNNNVSLCEIVSECVQQTIENGHELDQELCTCDSAYGHDPNNECPANDDYYNRLGCEAAQYVIDKITEKYS